MKSCPLHRKDGYIVDGRKFLIDVRRNLTRALNERKQLRESTCDAKGMIPFVDIQHFYNAMSFAILAFEEAYESTRSYK